MTVKAYAEKHGVSKQSVYDRIKRGTLSVEVLDGVKHIIDKAFNDPLTATLPAIDTKCRAKLEKALKKGLKSKHRLDLERVKVKSMEDLLASRDAEILSLKKSLDFIDAIVSKKLMLPDHPEDHVIDIVESVPGKKKKGKKKRKK